MRPGRRQPWRVQDSLLLAALLGVGAYLHREPLMDIITIGLGDEEQSHIFLAPVVALWLLWLRRTRLRYVSFHPSFFGPITAGVGWVASWWGFISGVQIAWHGGAIMTLVGILMSFTGLLPLRLFAPVFAALAFMLPVPGVIRHEIAHPLQAMAADITHTTLELIGVVAVRSGNVLIINGEQVAVGEACNGMRMVFALMLVVYAFAFCTPLKTSTRLLLLLASPLAALASNVVRLVPTSLFFGYANVSAAQTFHDLAGWLMLPVALLSLIGLLRVVRWLEFPVTSFRLAGQ